MGRIGLAWYRYQMRSEGSTTMYNYNVFFALLDPTGVPILSPMNLTNAAWAAGGNSNVSPQIVATSDNRFVVSWQRNAFALEKSTSDIFAEILDTDGAVVIPATQITSDAPGATGTFYSPNLALLAGDGLLLTIQDFRSGNMLVAVLDSRGNVVRAPFALTSDGSVQPGSNPDAAQLSDGRILVAWRSVSGGQHDVRLAILDASYNVVAGPTILANPLGSNRGGNPSVSADGAGHGIITWQNGGNLFYALVDSSGVVLTPPMIFMAAAPGTAGIGVPQLHGLRQHILLVDGLRAGSLCCLQPACICCLAGHPGGDTYHIRQSRVGDSRRRLDSHEERGACVRG